MEHLSDIKNLLNLLLNSSKFHLLIVKGPPGWGKTQTITKALIDLGINYNTIGTFATPLAFYNQLAGGSEHVHLLDDTAEVFTNPQLLSILCSASWPTGSEGRRLVKRTSTSEKSVSDQIDFRGKLIVITNKIPKSAMTEAILSRSLQFSFEIDSKSIPQRLLKAAESVEHYPDTRLAIEVAEFLYLNVNELDSSKVNLRTLELGYDLATPARVDDWKEIYKKLLPWVGYRSEVNVIESVKAVSDRVESQVAEYCRLTGKSRRSYFYEKKKILTTAEC